MTEREKQVWIAVFGAEYQASHKANQGMVLARNAVHSLRARILDDAGLSGTVSDMARDVMGDEE